MASANLLIERIAAVFQSLTAEEYDRITEADLEYLSEKQVGTYIYWAQKQGRQYYVDLHVKVDEKEWELRSGTFSGWVVKNKTTGEWELKHGGGLVPLGLMGSAPRLVDRGKFVQEMTQKGAPEELIKRITSSDVGITS